MTKKITTMKFKGTKHELVEILNGLYSTAELAGKEFAIASSKNISTIKVVYTYYPVGIVWAAHSSYYVSYILFNKV